MMHSETSTEPSFRIWHFFMLASLATATAAVLLSPATAPARLVLTSLVIGAAGFTAAGLYRTLAPLAGRSDEADDQPLGARTRAALEKDKVQALRAIKELDFDRDMGKVAHGDYDEMMARLRSRAARLIAELDESDRRSRDAAGGQRRNSSAKSKASPKERRL
jgi:hypothetical protein